MKKWNYLFEEVDEDDLEGTLNSRGEEGWELVSCHRYSELRGGYKEEYSVTIFALIMKRQT